MTSAGLSGGLARLLRTNGWSIPCIVGLLSLAAYWPAAAPNLSRLHGLAPPPDLEEPVAPVGEIVEPLVGVPGAVTGLWSDRLSGWLAAFPSRSSRRRAEIVAASAGALAVAVSYLVARWASGGVAPAVAAALAFGFSASFWGRTVAGTTQPLAAVLLWVTVWCLARWVGGRRAPWLWLGAVAYGLAVEAWPAAVLLLPGIAWWAVSDGQGWRTRLTAVGPFVVLGLLGLVHHAVVVRALVDQLAAGGAFGSEPASLRQLAAGYGLWATGEGRPVLEQAVQLVRAVQAELGVLGIVCFVAGVARLAPVRHPVLMCWAGSAATLAVWVLATGAEHGDLAALPVVWLSYAIVAAGVAWLVDAGRERRARVWIACLLLTLPLNAFLSNGRAAWRARDYQALVANHVERLMDVLPAEAVVVAESAAIDRALVTASVARGRRVRRVAPAALGTAVLAPDDRIFGFYHAAERAARLGLEATRLPGQGLALTVSEYIDSLPAEFIVIAAVGPGFWQVAEPRREPTFASAGGRVNLFDMRAGGSYVFVGVVGADAPVAERLASGGPVEVVLPPGDPLDRPTSMSPAAIRARSGARGARIVVNRRLVVEAETGLALSVVSPQGRVVGACALELGKPPTLSPNVAVPFIYRLAAPPPDDVASDPSRD